VAPTGLDLGRLFARWLPTGTTGGPAPPDPLGRGGGADVQLDGVTLVIEGTTVLRDVTLAVKSGTRLAIVGPNGSGKTMLARVLAGACQPSGGRVVVEPRRPDHDRAVAHVSRTLQRTIAAPTLPTATVVRAAAEPTRATGWLQALTATPLARSEQRDVERRVSSILAWCGISSAADQPIGTLDATEHRLTQLASAMVSRPSVMILDEPTSGLDDDGTQRVTERINALHVTGITVIVIEHDHAVVRSFTDQYVVMLDGQIRSHGDSDTIDNDPVVRAVGGAPTSS
jgi:ABC-type branched-subunit amino acid transport system ATPase component